MHRLPLLERFGCIARAAVTQARLHGSRRTSNVLEPMLVTKTSELGVMVEIVNCSWQVEVVTLRLN